MKICRFYGSCGHIEDSEISEHHFSELTKEIINKTIFGDLPVKNEVTQEEGNEIVHVHPFRFFVCMKCMEEAEKEALEIHNELN